MVYTVQPPLGTERSMDVYIIHALYIRFTWLVVPLLMCVLCVGYLYFYTMCIWCSSYASIDHYVQRSMFPIEILNCFSLWPISQIFVLWLGWPALFTEWNIETKSKWSHIHRFVMATYISYISYIIFLFCTCSIEKGCWWWEPTIVCDVRCSIMHKINIYYNQWLNRIIVIEAKQLPVLLMVWKNVEDFDRFSKVVARLPFNSCLGLKKKKSYWLIFTNLLNMERNSS